MMAQRICRTTVLLFIALLLAWTAQSQAGMGKAGMPATATGRILTLAPESTTVAAAIPSTAYVYDRVMHIVRLALPEELDLDTQIALGVAQAGAMIGVADAATYKDLFRGLGLDPDAPVAVFADLSGMLEGLTGVMKTLPMQMGVGGPPGAGGPMGMGPDINISMDVPVAVVIGCSDTALFESSVARLAEQFPMAPSGAAETVEVDGFTIHSFGPETMSYCAAGDYVIMGNKLDYVREVVRHVKSPGPAVYGGPGCPPIEDEEIVVLVETKALAPMIKDIMSLATMFAPGTEPIGGETMQQLLDEMADSGPLVVTMSLEENRLDLLTRMDYAGCPAAMKLMGQPVKLRQAMAVPEQTVAMFTLHITSAYKDFLKETWMGSIPPQLTATPEFAQIQNTIELVMSQLGREFTLAVTGGPDRQPGLLVAIGLENEVFTKSLLKTVGVPMEPLENYAGVDIIQVPELIPVPIYFAFVGDNIVFATDLADLKASLTLAAQGTTSPWYATLESGFDPSKPHYNALVFTSAAISDALKPLLLMVGVLSPGDTAELDMVTDVFRELTCSSTLVDGWQHSHIAIRWNEDAL